MRRPGEPFERGCPGDLPIRPANLVQLDWMALTPKDALERFREDSSEKQ